MGSRVFDLGIGALELLLGGVVLAHLWRFRRGFPWLIALTGFFFLRGVDRIAVAMFGTVPDALGHLVDPLIVAVLALLLFSIERIVHSLELAEDAARLREQEYARALVDYRRLVRHRLATPLTAILGSARFLRELGPEDTELRAELLEILEREVVRLEHVSLDPHSELNADEQSLRPSPSVDPELADAPSSRSLDQASARRAHEHGRRVHHPGLLALIRRVRAVPRAREGR